ncbi:MAG: SIS domain-containing protein [Polyangiaceae bacterium]
MMKPADIEARFETLATLVRASGSALAPEVDRAARLLIDAFEAGRRVFAAGNGGSAADAQHFTAELVGRFRAPARRPLAAIALTTDTSAITSIANDSGYDHVFERQLEALASPGDVFIAISTSGRSPNIVRAAEAARRLRCAVVALTGAGENPVAALANVALVVPSLEVPRIQEVHGLVLHTITEIIDDYFGGAQ